jgi:hypothetical protein
MFHCSDIKFWVSGLILLTGTELLQKSREVRQVSEFHVGDRKLRDTLLLTFTVNIDNSNLQVVLSLAVGLQHHKISMCIMIILTCFLSPRCCFSYKHFHL